MRFHACWGNRDGPHVNDVPATDVLPVCYQVKVGALCLPFANPRHSHEVDAFKTQRLPDRMTLVCGVVETTHNYVEHPQVIAERLERAVRAVGDRERVMAGTDCGFGTIVGDTQVSEDVGWARVRRQTSEIARGDVARSIDRASLIKISSCRISGSRTDCGWVSNLLKTIDSKHPPLIRRISESIHAPFCYGRI